MRQDKLLLKTNILKEIFNIAPKKFKDNDSDVHFLAKKFNISDRELKNNMEFLFEMNLIKKSPGAFYKKDRVFEWIITDKGLNYLKKNQSEKRQEEFNRIIAFTGAILALVAIYGLIIKIIPLENYPVSYWIVNVVFLILIILCLGPLTKFIINFWKRESFGK